MNNIEIIVTIRRDKERINDQQHFIDRFKLLLDMGIHTFRINIAKWNKEMYKILTEDVKCVRNLFGKEGIKILLDVPLPGEKSRILTYKMSDIDLKKGDKLKLYPRNYEKNIDKNEIRISVSDINKKLNINDEIIYGDGEGKLKVDEIVNAEYVVLTAMNNFKIEHSKALSFRNSVEYSNSCEQDIIDLINNIKPDILALSFVEKKEHIEFIRNMITGFDYEIMSKIETQNGVDNFSEILDYTDSIMVGRGDLGLNIKLKNFADIQNSLVASSVAKNKKIYIATDVLNSMCKNKYPSRADLMDLYCIEKSKADGVVLTYGLVRSDQIVDAINLINKQ